MAEQHKATQNATPDEGPKAQGKVDRKVDLQLERAIEALRAPVAVRDEWRVSLERELLEAPAPVRILRRGWHVTPWMAAAAVLVCMLAGAGTDRLLRPGSSMLSRHEPGTPAIEAGNANSGTTAMNAGTSTAIGVRFSVMAPHVTRVSVVGDFNGWNADATPLQLARDGQTWTTVLPLAAGRHAYAFVIDGEVVRDPSAPASPDEDFGVPNSLVLVSAVR